MVMILDTVLAEGIIAAIDANLSSLFDAAFFASRRML